MHAMSLDAQAPAVSRGASAPLPMAGRAMEVRAVRRAADADTDGALATARLAFSAGAAVPRYDWYRERAYVERLVVEPGAVRLDRLKRGVPLLNAHGALDLADVLGVCDNPAVSNGVAECDATFSRRDDVAGYVRDVRDRVIRNVSVGYVRHRVEMEPPAEEAGMWTYRVTDWEPMEVSLVPIPADMDAQVRSSQADASEAQQLRTFPCEFIETRAAPSIPFRKDPSVTTAQTQHNTHRPPIASLVKRHGLPESFATELAARNVSDEQARAAILEELARQDQSWGGHHNTRTHRSSAGDQRTQMLDALTCRLSRAALPDGNPFRHASVVDLARECLEVRGIRTADLSRHTLIERALHTTSDFPELLSGAGERNLRQSYTAYQGGLKRAFKASTARDFRAKQHLQLGEGPTLLKVNEHGEFTHGTTAEAKTSYSLATYGRIIGLTRQALINDDLEAFATMTSKLGISAAEFEAKFLVTLLTSNPLMSDGVALFHATHGNLGTGAASALQFSSLTTARQAMRLQKGLDGVTPIDATPQFLIVPAALETTAETLIADITANEIAKVNPFSGKLELIVDPRLDAVSATAWYLAANPNVIDTIEYSYLDSANGPEVMSSEGWEVDGIELKVRLDFGAGALDWRGLQKYNGV